MLEDVDGIGSTDSCWCLECFKSDDRRASVGLGRMTKASLNARNKCICRAIIATRGYVIGQLSVATRATRLTIPSSCLLQRRKESARLRQRWSQPLLPGVFLAFSPKLRHKDHRRSEPKCYPLGDAETKSRSERPALAQV